MYTLIAFKPEKYFHDRGSDYAVLPAKLIREDNLTREECIQKIIELSTETPLIEYTYGQEHDCVFEEFHLIPIKITEEIEDFIWNIKDEAYSKIEKIKEEKRKEQLLKYEQEKEEKLNKEKEEKMKQFLKLKKELAL